MKSLYQSSAMCPLPMGSVAKPALLCRSIACRGRKGPPEELPQVRSPGRALGWGSEAEHQQCLCLAPVHHALVMLVLWVNGGSGERRQQEMRRKPSIEIDKSIGLGLVRRFPGDQSCLSLIREHGKSIK